MIYSRGEIIKVAWVALGGGRKGQEMGGIETEVKQKKRDQEMSRKNVWQIVRGHVKKRQNS